MSGSYRQIPKISRWSLIRHLMPWGKLSNNELHRLKPGRVESLGPIMRYPLRQRVVDIYRPEDVGCLLRSDDKWPIRPILPLIDLAIKRGDLQPSISHLNGAAWAEIRTEMQKIFLNPSAATQFYAQQDDVCRAFMEALAKEQAAHSMVRDFRSWACRFAAESVGQILIGAKMGSFTNDPNSPGNRLCDSMDRLFTLTTEGFTQPPWSSYWRTKLYKEWLHQHRIGTMLVEELISLYGFSSLRSFQTLPAHSDRPSLQTQKDAGDDAPAHSFFSELLARQDISERKAIEFAEELFIAGVESTGNAVTFLIYHLARNPAAQEKLYKEIVGNLDEQGQITPKSFSTLSYLKACMKESMRMSPPVTGTVRVTSRDTVLSDYRIPRGTIVNTGSDVICQLDSYFEKPVEFRPERWLPNKRQSIQPFSFIPFGHGVRMCIGRRFAEQELMMAAMSLVREYWIELIDPNLKVDRILKVFYSPDRVVDIKLTKRPTQRQSSSS